MQVKILEMIVEKYKTINLRKTHKSIRNVFSFCLCEIKLLKPTSIIFLKK